MSTNQSFIKAYRRDASEPSPIARNRGLHSPRSSGARAHAMAATQVASAQLFGSSVTYVAPGTAFELDSFTPITDDAVETSVPLVVPHYPASPEAFPIAEPRAGETIPTPRMDRPSSGMKRPLSSFTNRANRSAPVAPTPPASLELRPGTTIASFQWPEVCRTLLARHGRLFDRVIDSILEQVNQGRSVFGALGLFRGVGCTTTSICLAARLARDGRRVVLVDGHFQAPQLATRLGAQPTAWWQDVLERRAPLADAMIRAEDDCLDLLPLGPHARRGSRFNESVANGLQISATAGAIRHAYDFAIVDLGTFFDPSSQPVAIQLVQDMRIDGVLAVTEPGRQDVRDLNTLNEHLARTDCEFLGTIENRARDARD